MVSAGQDRLRQDEVAPRGHFEIQRIARDHPHREPGRFDDRRVIRKSPESVVGPRQCLREPIPAKHLGGLHKPQLIALERGLNLP